MEQDVFAEIRPYNDSELRGVLDRLLGNPELIAAITRLRFPHLSESMYRLLHPVVRWVLGRQMKKTGTVADFQRAVEKYMSRMVESTTTEFSVSGLERLDPHVATLFIGNHRDIALDPAFINYALYANHRDTVRIAIGDNLLTREYASDLMRLNKSFIVRRSAKGPRQMLAIYQELSAYIHHSIVVEHHSVWLAQREGRAKDGWDRTEPAIIKMLCLGKPKQLAMTEHIHALHIVPVAISYEWDPCDAAKARELYLRADAGAYEKTEHEDVSSIARSITSEKGAVHVSFGEPLEGDFATPESVASEIDRQILGMYRIHTTNLAAYRLLRGELPVGFESSPALVAAEDALQVRLAQLPEAQRPYMLAMYANPLVNRDGAVTTGIAD